MKHGRIKNCFFAFLITLFLPIAAAGLDIHFSPNEGVNSFLTKVIDDTKKNLDIMMYSFTSEKLAKAVVRAHKRGVVVRVLLDETQAGGQHSQDEFLIKNGVKVRIENQEGSLHNKVTIVDGKMVITGSYNWTTSAEEKNQENIIIFTVEDDEEAVMKYQERFETLWHLNSPDSHKTDQLGGING